MSRHFDRLADFSRATQRAKAGDGVIATDCGKEFRMDLEYLKQLIRLAKKSGVTELEIEENGVRIRLRNDSSAAYPRPVPYPPIEAGLPAPVVPVAPSPPPVAPPAETADPSIRYIESPMVGTFYRAPAPDSPPFVNPGSQVEESTVVCVIEAMKIMNDIKANMRGVVADVLVENGQPVEYGQPLFAIKPS